MLRTLGESPLSVAVTTELPKICAPHVVQSFAQGHVRVQQHFDLAESFPRCWKAFPGVFQINHTVETLANYTPCDLTERLIENLTIRIITQFPFRTYDLRAEALGEKLHEPQ